MQPFVILLLPDAPELFGRAGCRVFDGVLVGRHDELRKFEEMRDIRRLLVADHLPDGLFHGDMRGLALDDGKGNAIDEQHDIRAGVVLPVPAVHGELLRDVEHVVLRVVPVDIAEIEAEHFAVADGLRIAFAQQQRVINLLAGAHEAVRQRFVQILHGALDVGGGELVFRTRIDIAVESTELTAQDVPEQHVIPAAALLVAIRRGNVGVAHGLKQRKGGALACVDFQIGVFVHEGVSFRKGAYMQEERGRGLPRLAQMQGCKVKQCCLKDLFRCVSCVDDVFQILFDLLGVIRAVIDDAFQRFFGEVFLYFLLIHSLTLTIPVSRSCIRAFLCFFISSSLR